MLSTKEVVAKVNRLQTRYAARDQRMRDVLSVRQGDISKVYPAMFSEEYPKPLVANFTPGKRVVFEEDVDAFLRHASKNGGKKPYKHFTAKSTFSAFYNNGTGKREPMPQTAIWTLNKNGLYDMIDQDPYSGEVYYQNVDLVTGLQMIDQTEAGEGIALEKPSNLPGPETTINIYTGKGDNAELSNFAYRPFTVPAGNVTLTFNTVEGAFQAAKLGRTNSFLETKKLTPAQEKILEKLQTATGAEAKKIGQAIKDLNKEKWDSFSEQIMQSLIRDSFAQNIDALQKLLDTGKAKLTHVGGKTDKWTTAFPKILTYVRDEFAENGGIEGALLSDYTMHSGGAEGADTEFWEIGYKKGLRKGEDYTVDDIITNDKNLKQEIESAYQTAVEQLGRRALPYDWSKPDLRSNYAGGLVRRDYLQAKNSDGVFAISDIIRPGEKGKEIITKDGKKIRYSNRTQKSIVDGGTGYAVQMAFNLGKPVYVFHQGSNVDNVTKVGWYKLTDKGFVKTDTPLLTEEFAGIGTRQINEAGKQAIADLYDNLINNLKAAQKVNAQPAERKTYSGTITSLQPDQIFVFGSNPEGRHGAGAAKYAKDNFGAIYGQGEGLQGQSYALPTKDLRVKENKSLRSISSSDITNSIKKLYALASRSNKEFLVSDYSGKNLNGYTGQEMADMFVNAGPIPVNVIFHENFNKLVFNDSVKDERTIEQDMQMFQELVKANKGKLPKSFMSGSRKWTINQYGNYDLVDATTGDIYQRNVNMETGLSEPEASQEETLDPAKKESALTKIQDMVKNQQLAEQLAIIGYDVKDLLNNLVKAKTMEEYNKVMEILDKLC